MAHKKIVFIIVEGPSDEQALDLSFSKIFDNNLVHTHVVHGDLTTTKGNIKNEIANIVRDYANSNHFKKSDFQEIIHIVDMDGAYICDEYIKEDASKEHPFYSVNEICTKNIQSIKMRNETKRNNINIISSLPTAWGGVPYQAYYMSCNLDHVLYNKLNSDDIEKERDSYLFAKRYKDDILGFKNFIINSDFSVKGSYLDSWNFIKLDKHSLERYTNLGICFQRSLDNNNDVTEK